MKKPWKKDDAPASAKAVPASQLLQEQETDAVTTDHASRDQLVDEKAQQSKAFTPKKGRPTPKRNEVEREVGARRPAYGTAPSGAEARKRRKELKNSMSKDEYKAMKQRERDEAARARRQASQRMMAGDESYLMDRDKGPEKRFVRDWVDSHRYLMNFFLPMTFVVIVVLLLGMRNPALANLSSIIMMAVFVIMIAEGLWLGRKINRMVAERFPNNPHSKFGLGMYAFTRATMIRRMRTPSPQKNIGDTV
ncbi:DUF3043 domain-containing protein [Corynebacterium suicordis]|uniref:DUF3043 domain-containing protein n=1 Tax=Corynebacterium suicordis TaxID=203264 RepID=UPI0025959819|nr:DUF3043 domain-containing protein [Corynebacterium suicordis]MDR6277181.1 hypothetical protein [Corynebacterium suicordis]